MVVVDDAPAIAEVLRSYLGYAGYAVDAAPDGRRALELIERVSPDVVVTDVLMPLLSGTDLLRRLRADDRHRHIPVVLFTGLPADNADIQQALTLPLTRLVLKGKPFRSVVAAIEELSREAAAHTVPTPSPQGGSPWHGSLR